MDRLQVGDAQIEYEVFGRGEPVLLIPGGLVADGLGRPLLAQPELASRYRLIYYHRRGYLGSTPGSQPPAIPVQAGDAIALLGHLDVKSAHVVGHSIGALIALQLADDAPGLAHSLALLEPPLYSVPSGQAAYERGFLPLLNLYRAGNKRQAVELFGNNVFGPGWQALVEQAVPGGVEQAFSSVDTFMREMATVQEWQYGPRQAAWLRQPVLSMVGERSQPFMREGRALLHSWIPQAEDFDPQSTHLLQMQDPAGVARGLAGFFARHPIPQVAGAAAG